MKDLYHIYLETSAVNYLLDNFTVDELGVMKRLLIEEKNACFCISATTISEILLTSDELRKEKLIFCLQNICHEKIINSPAEFIINYIKSGMPKEEKKYNFYSNLQLSRTWADICKNPNKTFIYNFLELKERMKFLQKSFKQMTKDLFMENSYLKKSIDDAVKMDKDFKILNEDELKIKQICWLLIFLFLCCGDFMDNAYIDDYWNKLGYHSTFDRLLYSMYNLQALTVTGPIVMMAIMWHNQIGDGNRGTLLDMFHSIYIVYCDTFLTNDEHFKKIQVNYEHINFEKISLISENTFFTGLRKAFDSYVPSL